LRYGRRYRVEVRRPNGDKVRKSAGKRAGLEEARQLEHELKEMMKRELGERSEELTWGQVTQRYLRQLEIQGRYLKNAILHMRSSLQIFGNCPVSHITAERAREWHLELRSRLSPKTCDCYLQSCRAAWNAVVGEKNPFQQVRYFNPKNEVTRYLHPEERQRLLDAARQFGNRWYEWVAIGMGTGLRQKNVTSLRRDEIDWKSGYVRVTEKGGDIYAAPLSPGIMALLRLIPDNGTPYFWFNERTGKPFSHDWKTWTKIKCLAGIDPKFRWHDLRHDFGTNLLKHTGNLKVVQDALGHANIKTTERYAHLLPETLRSAINEVDPLKPHIAHPPAHLHQKDE